MTIRTWKVKGNGGTAHDLPSHEFFIKNNCISCGWSFSDVPQRDTISSFEEYKIFWNNYQKTNKDSEEKVKKWGYQGVHQLFGNVQKGDFVWTRSNGVYYVAEIPDDPQELFYFDTSDEAAKYDCSAQLRNIKWTRIGKEDSVPGSISTYTKNRASILRVDNNEVCVEREGLAYTYTSLYSGLAMGKFSEIHFEDKKMLFKFIGYSGLEDVVALWLYDKFNYVVIPSTNKISTAKYEFVLVDGSKDSQGCYINDKKIYIQVKNGDTPLNSKDYTDLIDFKNEELWLVTAYGEIDNDSGKKIARFFHNDSCLCEEIYELDELIDFVLNPLKKSILPDHVKKSIEYFV